MSNGTRCMKGWCVSIHQKNRSVLDNKPESLNELPDIGPKGIKFLQAFLKHLKDKVWL